ncbi:MAG: MATE family efflux transporter [Ruminococcaceae bacterium]|nr:MATE family efflux transporter [Oscillospiraceae bacterium]
MAVYVKSMTEGNELSQILKFSVPLLVGNLFQQLYNIVDSAIVGKYLGSDKLAAVGATGSITYLFFTLCIGLATGAGILIAQRFGAQDISSVKKLITNSAYLLAALGIFISVVSTFLAEPLLRFLDTPESLLPDAVAYMQISCSGTIAVALYNWINSVLRSLGDSRTPLYFLIVASVLNVGLDLLFVVVFSMDVQGAALATVIAQGASAVGSIIFALKKNPCFKLQRSELKTDMKIIGKTFATGIPIALQNALVSISMISLQTTANGFGEDIMAAYTASMRVEQLVQQPFVSLNVAVSTFAGQNIGAGKAERAMKGYHKTRLTGFAFALFMLVIFMLFGYNIVGIFVDKPEVLVIGDKALKLTALFYVPLSLIHITRGMLNGAGDVGFALLNGIVEVIGRIGFAFILMNIPSVGYWAVWGTTCLTWLFTAVMCILRYKFGGWRKKLSFEAKLKTEQ